MIEAITRDANLRGEGIGLSIIEWASAVLNNGIGNYKKAVVAVERATDYLGETITPLFAAVELIEAAARSGRSDMAADVLRRLAEFTTPSGTNWALGESFHSHCLEHVVGDAKLCARVDAAALPAEPFAVQQVRAGEICSDTGAAETLDRLAVETFSGVAVIQQRT